MLDIARQMRLAREVMMSATMRPSYKRLKCCVAISLSSVPVLLLVIDDMKLLYSWLVATLMPQIGQIRWVSGCQETFCKHAFSGSAKGLNFCI